MRAKVDRLGVTLRPHVKTAKSPDVAALMHEGSHCPITVSTLAEAEAFADSGYTDITYAVGIDPHKIPRVLDLHRRVVTVRMLIDSTQQASAIAEASHRAGTPAGEVLATGERALRLDLITAVRECRSALEDLLDLHGSSGLHSSNPLQRHWRDFAVGSRHVQFTSHVVEEDYGVLLLGVDDPPSAML